MRRGRGSSLLDFFSQGTISTALSQLSLACPLLSALSVGLGACTITPDPFVCTASDQCTGGTCERTGYCSFPNPDCESGREYGRYSAPELASTCVPPSAHSDSHEGSGDATTSGEESSTTGSSSSTRGDDTATTADSTTDEGTGTASETTTTTMNATSGSSVGETSDSGGTEGTGTAGSSGLAESSSTGASGLECFVDPFEGEGRNFDPFWSLEGEFPARAQMNGTGQLEFDINTVQAGSTVLLGTLNPSAPVHTVEMELGDVAISSGGREQLVFALGARQTVDTQTRDPRIEFQLSEAQLRARFVDGQGSTPVTFRSVTYSGSSYRYLRLRTGGLQASPSYHWESSTDGYSWSTFYCLSQTQSGCEWPEGEFPRNADFTQGTPVVLLFAGAFDVSSPPNPDAFRVETLSYCPFQ